MFSDCVRMISVHLFFHCSSSSSFLNQMLCVHKFYIHCSDALLMGPTAKSTSRCHYFLPVTLQNSWCNPYIRIAWIILRHCDRSCGDKTGKILLLTSYNQIQLCHGNSTSGLCNWIHIYPLIASYSFIPWLNQHRCVTLNMLLTSSGKPRILLGQQW